MDGLAMTQQRAAESKSLDRVMAELWARQFQTSRLYVSWKPVPPQAMPDIFLAMPDFDP